MSPLFDSGSHGLRAVRNPLIRGALQQCGKKFLVDPDSHNHPGAPPDWGPPMSRTGQLLKVVTSLSFVSPCLDLLVAHATSVEKVLTHRNFVYETRSQGLPLYRSTRQSDAATEPDKDPTPWQPADASELLPAVDLRCPAGGDLPADEPTAAVQERLQGARYLVGGPGWSGAGPAAVGTVVLPLSSDDPGAEVTCGSRALVTADKGNGPQCVRSFAGVGAGPVVHRLAPYRLDREAAGEMDIEDIDVFIGTGRR